MSQSSRTNPQSPQPVRAIARKIVDHLKVSLIELAHLTRELIEFGSRTCGLAREPNDFKIGELNPRVEPPCTSKEETQPTIIIED